MLHKQNAVLNGGVVCWNEWRKYNPGVEPDLSGMDLQERDLKGYDLQQANLTGSNLQKAELQGAKLQEANLTDANLKGVKGMVAEQIAGADVTNATLPEHIKEFKSLAIVEKACSYVRRTYVAMLLACAYSLLTGFITTDVGLVTKSATVNLPIVGATVSIARYYLFAPFFLLGFYIFFHVSMQRIWEDISLLPAILSDGRAIDRAVDPWLLTGLVRAHVERLQPSPPGGCKVVNWLAKNATPLTRIQNAFSIGLAWCTVPMTIAYLTWRYLVVHEMVETALHLLALSIVIVFGIKNYYLVRRTLRSAGLLNQGRLGNRTTEGILAVAKFLFWVGLGTIGLMLIAFRTFVSSRADLAEKDVSTKPANYYDLRIYQELFSDSKTSPAETVALGAREVKESGAESVRRVVLDSVKGANLEGRNLIGAKAERAFLVKANLRDADLTRADLRKANLEEADLTDGDGDGWGATLRRADLKEAVFRGADLRRADLHHADLRRADLREADLRRADLRQVDLRQVDLRKANLAGAILRVEGSTRADLSEADLSDADLSGAQLCEANLFKANLSRVIFNGAELPGANLYQADLSDAILLRADLHMADLREADLRGADLRGVVQLTQEQVDSACGDDRTDFPDLGLLDDPEASRITRPSEEAWTCCRFGRYAEDADCKGKEETPLQP